MEPELVEEATCDALGAGELLTKPELLTSAEPLAAFVALPTELPEAACELLRVVVLL